MQNKLFEIEKYEFVGNEIIALCFKKHEEFDKKFDRESFEKWLEQTSRLETTMNFVDEKGDIFELYGSMSLEEYWQSNRDLIHDDMYVFILTKIVDPNDIFSTTFKFNLRKLNK